MQLAKCLNRPFRSPWIVANIELVPLPPVTQIQTPLHDTRQTFRRKLFRALFLQLTENLANTFHRIAPQHDCARKIPHRIRQKNSHC